LFDAVREPNIGFLSIPVFIYWLILTLLYKSELIGFFAVASFSLIMAFTPKGFFDRCEEDKYIFPTLTSSFYLMIIYIGLSFSPTAFIRYPELKYFDIGVQFFGAFFYFLCLLILSNRYYYSNSYSTNYKWIFYNGLSIISVISCAGLSEININLYVLRGVAGTFLIFYIIFLFFQISWDKDTIVFGLMLLGAGALSMSLIAKAFPEYFIFQYFGIK